MAITIGGESIIDGVNRSNWETLARGTRVDVDWVMDRIDVLSSKLPDAVATAADEASEVIRSLLLATLVESLSRQVAAARRSVGLL